MMFPVRRAAAITGSALVLAITACSAAPTPASTSAPGAGAPATPAPATSAGTAANGTAPAGTLDFAGATVDGGRFDAAELAGTPVVLWFWAPF